MRSCDKVRAVIDGLAYTREISWLDARSMAAGLAVRYDEVPIKPMVDAISRRSPPSSAVSPGTRRRKYPSAHSRHTADGLVQQYGSIVLTTGNKSEMAVGYCTLYGDMAAALP